MIQQSIFDYQKLTTHTSTSSIYKLSEYAISVVNCHNLVSKIKSCLSQFQRSYWSMYDGSETLLLKGVKTVK